MSPEWDPAALLDRLRDDLGHRRIEEGISALEACRPILDALAPQPGSGVLTGLVAQWVDAGFDGPALLGRLLDRFPKAARSTLPLLDYLHLRAAEAVLAMANEDFETAIRHLLLVQSFETDIADTELLAIACFWAGRCFRKMGRYSEALKYTERAETLALSCGYAQMAAITQVTRSWLAFQKGKLQEATALLRQAEDALNPTTDFLSRGNIQSAYGRIARRQGKYERAWECFERAICEYRTGGGEHLQLARTLLNLAFVQRLMALQAQRDLDRAAATRRGVVGEPPAALSDARELRARIERIRREATEHLQEANETYERFRNHRGIANVHINRGLLYLDSGDLECAASEAAVAFAHGSEKSDNIVMARARTLQCTVENAAMEEQVGETGRHHEAAETFAREAVEFAGQTENRRLLARAYVWQGLTFAARPGDPDAARRCCEQATALLQPEGLERQHAWDDLEALKTRVLKARPIDGVLRAWSAGIVEHTSFQRMTEEFARIVIPKVWEREGRKVSKVAEKLSISPKKVRRILHSAGINEPRSPTPPTSAP
jgi:tetratricopeptide (TPR) repeat protein